MITATGNKSTGFVIEASEAVTGQKQRVFVNSESEMLRIAYFWNRLYICDKMTSFLKQRAYALSLLNLEGHAGMAKTLAERIERTRLGSFSGLCSLIVAEEQTIRTIAPREKSTQYHFYKSVICGIIEFCIEMHNGARLRAIPETESCLNQTEI